MFDAKPLSANRPIVTQTLHFWCHSLPFSLHALLHSQLLSVRFNYTCRTLIAPMDTNAGQPLLQAPGLGFQVLHYHRSSLDPDSSIIVHHIGNYHTFVLAQAAALFELRRTLNDYLRIGYYGRYYEKIDSKLWGLITAYKESTVHGYMLMREIPMNEFRLETLNV